jgi:hypothetical protein
MARAYLSVGVPIGTPARKGRWQVLSFRLTDLADKELAAAYEEASVTAGTLGSDVFRVELYTPTDASPPHADHRMAYKGIAARTVIFVGGVTTVLMKTGNGDFRRRVVQV